MDTMAIVLGLLGLVIGALGAMLVLRGKIAPTEAALAAATERANAADAELRRVREEVTSARAGEASAIARSTGAEARRDELEKELAAETIALRRAEETLNRLQILEGQLTQRLEQCEAARIQSLADARAEFERILTAERDRFEALEAAKQRAHTSELNAKQLAIDELKAYLAKTEETLKATFGDASTQALQKATENFLDLAKKQFDDRDKQAEQTAELRKKELERLLDPIQKELDELETLNREIEKSRAESEGAMKTQIDRLHQSSESLANALKKPGIRGAWGEAQLKQILESAGMVEGQNYRVQDSTDDQGEVLRTDVVVLLPKGREIVIDSKAPLDQYWLAMGAVTEDERTVRALEHARAVRNHLKALKQKEYWKRYSGSPDYVILFLPHEGAYQLACEHDKALLTDAQASRVVLANPMTLMNLVHLATYVMQEERLQENAENIKVIGAQLIQRLGKVMELMAKHGRHLRQAVDSYNESVGSLESRLVPAASNMQKLGVSKEVTLPTQSVDAVPRAITVREFNTEAAPTLSLEFGSNTDDE